MAAQHCEVVVREAVRRTPKRGSGERVQRLSSFPILLLERSRRKGPKKGDLKRRGWREADKYSGRGEERAKTG